MTEHPHYDLAAGPAPIEMAPPEPPALFTVRLIYKSGLVMDIVTDEFRIGKNEVHWGDYCNPRPLLFGRADLAAAFQMDHLDLPEPPA